MADDLSIFGGLPGNADEDRLRKARRRLQMRNNFVSEGPLPPRARPSGVGGSKLGPPPTPPPPVSFNTVAPAVTGTPQVGQTLTCSTGTWTNSPTSYSYAWRVGGVTQGTASTYVVQSGDVGSTIVCLVTARNAGGFSVPASSNTVGPVTAAPSGSTWSAADASANAMTLSNGGLTVAATTTAWQSVRGSTSHSSGKWYFEFTSPANPGLYTSFGVGNAGMNIASYLGNSNYSACLQSNGLAYYSSGFTWSYVALSPTTAANDVWSVAIDFAGNLWIAQNNVWFSSSTGVGNPATGANPFFGFTPATVGALFPAISLYQPSSGAWTLQATPSSQKYLPPPSFQAWDGGPVTPVGSTWSTADASANAMTLTNGGMTVSNPSVVNQSIRGTISKISGKLYVEFLANQTAGTTGFTVGFGVASSGFNPGSYMGGTQYSAGVYNGSTICTTGFTNNYSSSFVRHVGDVIGLAIDFSAGSIYIAYNNVWDNSSNPVTGTAPVISFVPATVGALFPTLTFQQLTGEQWTLQPTAASQKYAPPAGFTAWG